MWWKSLNSAQVIKNFKMLILLIKGDMKISPLELFYLLLCESSYISDAVN